MKNSNSTFTSSRVININNAVTSRKVYLNSDGVEMVADLRRFFEEEYHKKSGDTVQLSFPALVHTIMDRYIQCLEEKGYDIRATNEEAF